MKRLFIEMGLVRPPRFPDKSMIVPRCVSVPKACRPFGEVIYSIVLSEDDISGIVTLKRCRMQSAFGRKPSMYFKQWRRSGQ